MSEFEYSSVLISIVIALAISELMIGWGRAIRQRHRVRFYSLHTLVSLLALLFMAQFWSGFWEYRTVESWSFFAQVVVLAPALTLALIAFLLTPRLSEPEDYDLRAHYFRNHKWIFGLAALVIAELAAANSLVGGDPFFHVENAVRTAAVGVVLWLALSESEMVHGTAVALAYLLLVGFVLLG